MGQIALSMITRALDTLPSNTKVNPREHVQAITTRSGVQLLEINMKRLNADKEIVPPSDEEHGKQIDQTRETTIKKCSDIPRAKATASVNPFEPPIPFPQRLKNYTKFLKDILMNKCKLEEHETVMLTEECSARIQKKLPQKLKDSGSFIIPCTIGEFYLIKALCDLGASINLMSLSIFRKLGLGEPKPTTITLQLAD
ncbi:uncharacterized protein LOC111411322 [Olea europaea var. sylvestris]|uniref:uncharacterized protein LOC111411322 n=1 Tax=Olea europaea var. sylvestris TaxID=158386 RepID=UPI000C1D37A2|nr:uncharacterized protein LOC111411322 [Olea europaea var. sylvestris]